MRKALLTGLGWLVGVGVVAALVVLLGAATRPAPLTVQGEVNADRIDISPRVSGRIVRLNVDVGRPVGKGEVIAELDNPQVVTALDSARAALDSAEADFARVNSVRAETVAARRADLAAADADVVLYQETYKRKNQLLRSGDAARQQYDEAARNMEAAQRKRDAAAAALDLTVAGASKEERALSAAQVRQAESVVRMRQADADELVIRAPIDGEVTTKVADIGENFSAGSPLAAIVDMKNQWFTFNLREDLLGGLKSGDTFEVTVPAFANRTIRVRVTVINAEGQYATWKATRATGDFDLKTFEVRAVPVEPVDGLRPGMSAVVRWERGAAR
jgi:HlyD family secretion protein